MTTSFSNQPVRDLYYLVTQLAQARKSEANIKATLDNLNRQIKAEIEQRFGAVLKQYEAELEWAKAETQRADDQVRIYAVQNFDGENKKPHPAVSIGEYTVLEYDEADAFDWAKQTGIALKLDKKAFEQIAKVSAVECVTVKSEPRARIATDLSKYA